MRICVFSESPKDDAAIGVLIRALLGEPFEFVEPARAAGGWPSIIQTLPRVVSAAYYHENAQGFVVVADSDMAPVFEPGRLVSEDGTRVSRLFELQKTLHEVRAGLRPRSEVDRFDVAIGIAVPCLEAWLLCPDDRQLSETTWIRAMAAREYPYDSRRLKRRLFPARRLSTQSRVQTAVEYAQKCAERLDLLEDRFPFGFKPLADEIRSWRAGIESSGARKE